MVDFELILQTAEVLLRPLLKEDFGQLADLTNDQSMWTYFTSDLSDKAVLRDWIADAILQKENKTRLPFAVIDKASRKIVGSTSFGNISYRDKRIEIGWTWLGKEYQGKGINNQVKYLMISYCFEVLDFERVEFKTDVLNIPARKALSRIGMTEEGVLRSHTLMTHDRRRDTIFYSVLKSEWNALKIKNNWI
jgi:RimJ/RimL family protein N-acetyltransferase